MNALLNKINVIIQETKKHIYANPIGVSINRIGKVLFDVFSILKETTNVVEHHFPSKLTIDDIELSAGEIKEYDIDFSWEANDNLLADSTQEIWVRKFDGTNWGDWAALKEGLAYDAEEWKEENFDVETNTAFQFAIRSKIDDNIFSHLTPPIIRSLPDEPENLRKLVSQPEVRHKFDEDGNIVDNMYLVVLQWDLVDNVEGYEIWRRDKNGGTFDPWEPHDTDIEDVRWFKEVEFDLTSLSEVEFFTRSKKEFLSGITDGDAVGIEEVSTLDNDTQNYDLNSPGDITTDITGGGEVLSIAVEGGSIIGGWSFDENTLTIEDSYLAMKLKEVSDELIISVRFNIGLPQILTITAIDTT